MQKALAYIRQYGMIKAQEKIIVGVSGGADSVCLLFVLLEYQKEVPFEIQVVHIEHGVRGAESRRDAAYVEALCKKWEIPCEVRHFDVPLLAKERKISVEEAGRMVRYETFEKIAASIGAAKIAVAHNQNDQAETMIWNMARGSGLVGAGGIRPVRGRVIRPLLSCSRQEIEAYLVRRGIKWCEDSTNQETDYTRNCIRRHILPAMEQELNVQATEHLARLGREFQRTEDFLMRLTEQAAKQIVCIGNKKAELQIERFLQEEPLIQERLIRYCLEMAECPLKDLGRIHVEQILELCHGQSGRKITLPGGWKAQKNFAVLSLEQEETEPDGCQVALEQRIFSYNQENIPQKTYTKWFDYDKIKGKLCLRTRMPGDYLIIDRQGGRKKLKAYFIEEKIPADKRAQVPLVTVGSEILWVIGHRISEGYKVEETTKRVLELKLQGREE